MIQDNSMEYLNKDEIREILQHNLSLTDEDFLNMDETEFRARFRERIHHTLEIQLYHQVYRGTKIRPTQADYTKRLMGLWVRRGLSEDLPEYRYAAFLTQSADRSAAGEAVDLSPYAPDPVTPDIEAHFFTVLNQRRSVREYRDKDVPDELIDKVLRAGLWAAHGCNIQSVRFLVIKEDHEPGLFRGSDVPGGPVHLVLLQDMRCYRANSFTPVRNQLLDAGAAAENMVLAAHAVGLESVWLTFTDEMCKRLRARFELPDYLRIVTYVDVGYGDQTPFPPLRWEVKDTVLARV